MTRIDGPPRRVYPGRFGIAELAIGEARFLPWECLSDLKKPIASVSNAAYSYAKRHGLPKGAFTCRTLPRGIEIYRVK